MSKTLLTVKFSARLREPMAAFERLIEAGGLSLVRAAFRETYFLDPEDARGRTPLLPNFAAVSAEHYPGLETGAIGKWKGRSVLLDSGLRAREAWVKYSGRPLPRDGGYEVRHVWGKPWDPEAYTAGWNLCCVPFWLGPLLEERHAHQLLQASLRQASWDLFFKSEPVCAPPEFVADPGLDLRRVLAGDPIVLLGPEQAQVPGERTILDIRTQTKISWAELLEGIDAAEGRPESKTIARRRAIVQKMQRVSGWTKERLRSFFEKRQKRAKARRVRA